MTHHHASDGRRPNLSGTPPTIPARLRTGRWPREAEDEWTSIFSGGGLPSGFPLPLRSGPSECFASVERWQMDVTRDWFQGWALRRPTLLTVRLPGSD